MNSISLPVVDFSILNINDVSESDAAAFRESDKLRPLVDEVMKVLEEMRFCYLKNTGLSEKKIKELFVATKEVCDLPENVKHHYARRNDALLHGYSNREIERPQHTASVERFETFMVCPRLASFWPTEVPQFRPISLNVYQQFEELSGRVFDVLSLGLSLKDRTFLRNSHKKDHAELRSALYHRYPDDFAPEPGQLRFFPHCDIGTLSFIYQDSSGGLEGRLKDGTWISLPSIPGTVLLITGQLLQMQTSDRLRAVYHRVAIPNTLEGRRKDRHSVIFFPTTPDDFVYQCLDGSKKYEPVTFKDFFNKTIFGDSFEEL